MGWLEGRTLMSGPGAFSTALKKKKTQGNVIGLFMPGRSITASQGLQGEQPLGDRTIVA